MILSNNKSIIDLPVLVRHCYCYYYYYCYDSLARVVALLRSTCSCWDMVDNDLKHGVPPIVNGGIQLALGVIPHTMHASVDGNDTFPFSIGTHTPATTIYQMTRTNVTIKMDDSGKEQTKQNKKKGKREAIN